MSQFPTLSATTLAAINTVGRWLAQNGLRGISPFSQIAWYLAGNAAILPSTPPVGSRKSNRFPC